MRRNRRLPRAHAPFRLLARPRDYGNLADAFPMSTCRDDGYDISDYYGVNSQPRHAWRFRRVHARSQATRHSGAYRSRGQSHLRPTSRGLRKLDPIPIRNFVTGTFGPIKSHHSNKGMVFPGVQKSTWTCDKEARAGSSIASTTSNPISTLRTRAFRPKS